MSVLVKTVQEITCFLQSESVQTGIVPRDIQPESIPPEGILSERILSKRIQAENNGIYLDASVTGICQDSRRVKPGSLFVCIRGENADGHDFATKALEAGARALLVERFLPYHVPQIRVDKVREAVGYVAAFLYGWPSERVTMVGVTGTNGKTTVASLVKHVAAYTGHKTGMIGTLGVEVNNRLQPGSHTTPEAVDIQHTLNHMLDEGVDLVAMEMSSHALSLGRINGCAYDAVIFTNLSQDHLDYHRSMNEYLEAKTLAFSQPDFNKRGRMSILNGDDSAYASLRDKALSPVVTYGIDGPDLDYRAQDINVSGHGVSFEVVYGRKASLQGPGSGEDLAENSGFAADSVDAGSAADFAGDAVLRGGRTQGPSGRVSLRMQTPGRFSVYNALAVFAWAMESGYEAQAVCAALAEVRGVPGRFESVRCGQDFQVIVDYAHTPDGLINVLSTAREITQGRLICVFGCGGCRDRTKRPLMGQAVCAWSDHAIVTSDNPRTEDPLAIIDEILPGLEGAISYEVIPDRYKAIEMACRRACAGDTVVIAGKGHEDYQLIGEEKMHFDDREVTAEVLRELGKVEGQ